MDLYLYEVSSGVPALTFQNVASYTADQVMTEDGAVYEPLAEGFELSSQADCSETLRADWRTAMPSAESRLADLEELLAKLMFGGESV